MHSRRFAARPPRRAPTSAPSVLRPRPSVRRSSLSFLSPLFFAALQQKRHSRSSVARSRSVGRCRHTEGGRGRGGEGERGSSQAAYQRNFLGVIDRPLPPLSRRPPAVRLPSLPLALPLSPARSFSFLPSLRLARPLAPNPEHSERTNVSCRSIAREKFRGRFAKEYNLTQINVGIVQRSQE